MTSAISPPRRALADCSPSTQRIASETLDLPHPLGPTMAVTPGWKFRVVLSAKDLKPSMVKLFRYMLGVKKPQCKGSSKGQNTLYGGEVIHNPTTNRWCAAWE